MKLLSRHLITLGLVLAGAAPLTAQTVVNITATDDQAAETWPGQTPNPATIRVTRTGSTAAPLEVWIKIGGTAVRHSDFSFATSVGTSVTIPAGRARLDVPVNVVDDAIVEAPETIRVDLEEETSSSTPVPYEIGEHDRAEIDLLDNESLPPPAFVSVSGLTPASEGMGGPPVAGAFRIMRDGDTSAAVTVTYSVQGSADAGADYAAFSGSVFIPAGGTFADVAVTPVDDSVLEGDEIVTLTLLPSACASSHPLEAACYAFGPSTTADLIIEDNEIPPVRAVVDVAVMGNAAENSGGSPVAGTFRITRSENLDVALTVAYSVGGTATPSADYAALTGSVAIPAGVASVDVTVAPVDDSEIEASEFVTLTILPPFCPEKFPAAECYLAGASGSASMTILNDDVPPVRAVVNVAALDNAAEDSGGSPAAGAFRITRSANLEVTLTVRYSVGGTATPSTDYTPLSGSVLIPAGVASVDVTVTPGDDTVLEPGESVTFMILPPSCPELYPPATCYLVGASPSASVTILDNEIAPVVVVSGSQNTNVAGLPAAGLGSFTAYSTNGHIVSYQVRVDGALQVTGNTGYTNPPAPGTPFELNFAITNLTAGLHRVQAIVTDNLGNSGSGTNAFTVVVIQPPPPTFHILAVDNDAAETAAGETPNPGRFRIVMTGSPDLAFSFLSFAGTARENVDYTVAYEQGVYSTNGITNIWSQDIAVTPIDDYITESTETVDLQLCFVVIAWIYGVGAPIGTECSSFGAIINIRDNDTTSPHPIVRVTTSDADAQEVSPRSSDAQNPGAFTITRTAPATNDLPVHYTIAGTARNGIDYSAIAGMTVISNGTTSAMIQVTPLYDVLVEGNETVTLTLRPVTNAPLYLLDPGVNNSASVVIRDYAPTNIPVVRIKATDSQAIEQPSTSPYASFRIERSGSLAAEFTMPYDISGTAVNGRDYVALAGVANFPVGASFVPVTVIPYLDGETNEPDETVVLTLTPPPADIFPPPYLLGAAGTALASAGATIREDAPPRTRPLDRFERARRLRFPGRYRIVPLPVLPLPTVPDAEPSLAKIWAVEASNDFVTWQEIGETEDPEEFVDVDAGTSPQRFYRFRELPPTTP